MRFDEVLRSWSEWLERERIRYALIGGLAMQAWGHSRYTNDADVAVDGMARTRIVAHAEELGYETLFVSEGYSNHLRSGEQPFRIDFMYVYGATAEALFADAPRKPVVGDVSLPVARPEMLAAMKGISMKNTPRRVLIDGNDVLYLLSLPGVNREEIRDYYARNGMLDLLHAIEKHADRR
ncbi:MAG TPA: hypothetical protein VF824_06525 [Thermoanaerobaculia bacterium]|jgi:hypothetical protein